MIILEKLKELKMELGTLVESIQEGIYIADVKGNLTFVNQSYAEILGYSNKDKILGRNLAKDFYLNPNDKKIFLKNMHEEGFVKDYEIKFIRKNGDVVIISTTSNVIKDNNGNVIGIEGVIRDVTERNRWDLELKTVQKDLEVERYKLEQVLNIDHKISSILDLNNLVDFIIEKASNILEAERCSLMLLDHGSMQLLIKGAKGLDCEIIKQTRIKIGEQISGWVAQNNNPVLVNDIESDHNFKRKNGTGYNSRSFLSVPIKIHGDLIGVVNVSNKKADSNEDRVFTEIDLKILCTIVRQAAISIENANYYRRLEHLSFTDPLTGIYNHRYFIQALESEIARLKRYPKPLCILMIDVDDFKSYNDAYGHLEGDNLLREVGMVLEEESRVVDTACRYAGDEFVVILPETNLEKAKIVAIKIIKAIKSINFKKVVTVSIGISEFIEGRDRRELIMKADHALYQAKKDGKNQINCNEK